MGLIMSAGYSDEPPAWVGVLVVLTALASQAWGLWCTVIAFVGGTMPIIGVEVENGSLIGGLAMLLIGMPILLGIARLAAMVVLVPLVMLTTRLAGGRRA